jgi:magnesium chelatase subunit I
MLYVDEVNLLDDQIVDAILDAAAQGSYSVRRGAMAGTYRSRFVLIGSMNPEEGRLRPQIMDRFGLRVNIRGLTDPEDRLEVYRRVRAYRYNPVQFNKKWEMATMDALEDILVARELLKKTDVTKDALQTGINLVRELEIDSSRAEITMFEAARAHAAAEGRNQATIQDVRAVAPMALRQRRSDFMTAFFEQQQVEDQQITQGIDKLAKEE